MILASSLERMQPTDWAILAGIISILAGFAIYSRRYTRSVADFLTANRCAGRYLLTLAAGISSLGAISMVAHWEKFYQAGFSALFWVQMLAPVGLIMTLSGYVTYRFRETRAMTFPQFLEVRYSRKFRLFAGTLAWVSGVLNYGIFPAVTARFIIYFLGLPQYLWKAPVIGLEFNLTLGATMACLLGFALFITLNGGQVSIMITDFIQGQMANVALLALLACLLIMFPWSQIVETLENAPAGASLLNPFDSNQLPDFNPWFFVILLVLTIYNYRVWLGSQGYFGAALSPHEARMAGVLSEFRNAITLLLIPMAAICAYVLMNSPLHESATEATKLAIDAVGDPQIAKQMTTPLALANLLPVGMMGLMAGVIFLAAVSTDNTYMHSWGSIFIQDVVMPWRELNGKSGHIPTETHLRWLRWSIAGVAIFAWTFSMLFPLKEYILMYFQATGAIFTGGAGAVLIGGLYWKRGTTGGAWASMIVGCTLAVGGILTINLVWPTLVPLLKTGNADIAWIQALPDKFWLNGIQMAFIASVCALLSYVVVSLLGKDPKVNEDKLFHRGIYQGRTPEGPDHTAPLPTGLRAILPSAEFTRGDKVIYYAKLGWSLFFIFAFLIICTWQLFHRWPDSWWANWWFFNVVLIGVVGTIATIWFLIGGFIDMRRLFRRLANIERDQTDDGYVASSAQEGTMDDPEQGDTK